MDLAEIRLIHSVVIKERESRGGFLDKYARPPSRENPLKIHLIQ
jgi:hypothetical protein